VGDLLRSALERIYREPDGVPGLLSEDIHEL